VVHDRAGRAARHPLAIRPTAAPVAAVVVVLWLATAAVASWADVAGEQMDFADGLYVRGMYDMAAVEYAKYLERDGSSATAELALFRMAECFYHLKRYSEAAKAFERLLAEFPTGEKSAAATVRFGEVQYRLGNYSQTVTVLEQLLGRGVDDPLASTALYYLGEAQFAAGDLRKSIATFDRLVTDHPTSALVPYARFACAAACFDLEDYRRAADQFAAVYASNGVPASVRSESMLKAGIAYGKSGQFDKAAAALQDTAANFPSSPFAEEARYERAWVAYHADKLDDALRLANAFIEAYPEGTSIVGAQYLKGRCLQSLAKYADAERVFAGISSSHPSSPFAQRANYQLCWTAYWQGRYDVAAARAEALLGGGDFELRGETMFVYGLTCFAQSRFADALDQFSAVSAKFPQCEFAPEAEYHRARSLAELDRHAEAARAFTEFVSRRPKHKLASEARLGAAQQEFLAGEYTVAAAQFAKLSAEADDDATRCSARFMAGRAYQNAGRTEAAIEAYSDYVASSPKGPTAAEALYQIGVIEQGQKEADSAVAAYNRLLAEYPESGFALRARRNLGHLYYDSGRMDKAAEAFSALLHSSSGRAMVKPETLLWLANYLYDHEDFETGRTAYEQYAQVSVSSTERQFAGVRAAECAFMAGEPAAAAEAYRAVIESVPEGPYIVVARLGLGRALLAANQPDDAIGQLTQVVEVGDPTAVAEAQALLGDAQSKLANYDEALRHYMLVAMVYDHPELSSRCYIKAADILGMKGEREKEMKLYRELLSAYPESEQAAIARARLGMQRADRGSQ